MKIDNDVIEVLGSSRVEGNLLYLPPRQLERTLYTRVNKVLECLQGKWQKKLKAHLFIDDIEEKLTEIINTGEVLDKKKELQYFPTPKNVVKQMIELAELKEQDLVLETSAGQGAILEEIYKIVRQENIGAIEIDKNNCDIIRKKGFIVADGDFLTYLGIDLHKYDKIIQNPPFNIKGNPQADIDFILHAWRFLKPGGILVSICSPSPFFRSNKKSEQFRTFLNENNAKIIDLPENTFAESGTSIRTKLIRIKK